LAYIDIHSHYHSHEADDDGWFLFHMTACTDHVNTDVGLWLSPIINRSLRSGWGS